LLPAAQIISIPVQKVYQNPAHAQRPNFTVLRRAVKSEDWQSDFRADITLEDGRRYHVGVIVSRDRNGEDILLLHLRAPRPLSKTPVTPRKFEVVRP
jgi:hypothetical protein